MDISKRQADAIIDNLRAVITEDINIISPKGIIIASSDSSRVGSFHEGALVVAQTLEPLEIEEDDDFKGAKSGLNLPVFVEKNLVAVVGITGQVSKISKYSDVIVKMSEILFREYLLNVQKEFKRENNRILIELITQTKLEPRIVAYKMSELGYDVTMFHYVVIFKIHELDQKNVEVVNLIYNSIEKRLGINNLLSRMGSKYILISTKFDYEALMKEVQPIKDYVERKYQLRVSVGVSQYFQGVDYIQTAFSQADTVVSLIDDMYTGQVVQFDAGNLGLLLRAISTTSSTPYVQKIFEGMDESDLEQFSETLHTYVINNGSINESANALFIHKNTMQYRLNKIHEKTGYNPRELIDLMHLYIALLLKQSHQEAT